MTGPVWMPMPIASGSRSSWRSVTFSRPRAPASAPAPARAPRQPAAPPRPRPNSAPNPSPPNRLGRPPPAPGPPPPPQPNQPNNPAPHDRVGKPPRVLDRLAQRRRVLVQQKHHVVRQPRLRQPRERPHVAEQHGQLALAAAAVGGVPQIGR